MHYSQQEVSDATVSQMHTNMLTKTSLVFRLVLFCTNSSHYSQQYENQLANSSIPIFILSPMLPNPQCRNHLLKITDEISLQNWYSDTCVKALQNISLHACLFSPRSSCIIFIQLFKNQVNKRHS